MRAWPKKLIIALLVGVSLGFVHNTIPGDGTAILQIALFHVALFPLAVLFISRPLSSYRQSIAIVVVVIVGWTAVKLTIEAVTQQYLVNAQMMCLVWGVYGFIGLVVNTVLVSLAVLLRRRLYPIYPSGHCQRCGYNLTGNVSGRCPECGAEV